MEAGDSEEEEAEAADYDEGVVKTEWNQKQAACGEDQKSGGKKDFE